MSAIAVRPAPGIEQWLPGADFIDAFSIELTDPALDARRAAERMLARQPRWVSRLMALRNAMVKPFGLKRPEPSLRPTAGSIGVFPVIAEMPERIVLGFDDRHLDFRIVVDVLTALDGQRKRVTATTLVHRNNRLGRIYLAIILPFHRRVARASLNQVAG